jgi:hypothetical protein
MRYHALGLFLEYSVNNKYKVPWRQKILITITCVCSMFFIVFMAVDFNRVEKIWMPEIVVIQLVSLYANFILPSISLWYIFKQLNNKKIPRILIYQIKILIFTLVIPNLIMDFLQICPLIFQMKPITSATNSYTLLCMTNILFIYMIYYCARKMVGLRFLNMKKHVQSTKQLSLIDDFYGVIIELGKTKTVQEINFITQEIFQKAFNLPLRATTIQVSAYHLCKNRATPVDKVFSSTDYRLSNAIRNYPILIRDDIEFDNFYMQDKESASLLEFLDNIGADIFIPLFNEERIIAYVIIERNARKELYNNVERNEMIGFAQYLGNIINRVQTCVLENVLAAKKEISEEVHFKHQEVNQYKESMRSFLRHSKHSRIGIIFYKNRQFVFGNREAQDMFNINLNVQVGHPFAKACSKVVADAAIYQATQTVIAHDENGNKIVITGMPYLERTHVILILYYPEATDLIQKQINQLKDPSEWDYLLYLETTHIGRCINQLIPSSSTTLLNFKIDLLKAALSNKAILLDMSSDDLMATVEMLHHVSLRSQLHTLSLEEPQTSLNSTIQLFGMNPLFGMQQEEPLLKKLHEVGTLFIQNVHFLNREAQEHLAEYIHYGYFRPYKSDQKIFSSVRIICSSTIPLEQLELDGKTLPLLTQELQKTQLIMPTLSTLQEEEIDGLVQGFFQQALVDKTFENFLEFDKRDLKRIIDTRPTSLLELKKRVHIFLRKKSHAHNINEEKTFDPGSQFTDPDLIEIARLGKRALKDEKAMTVLWNKFKCQNKIAIFLGVNRSSVNRRCKDYKLIDY